MITSLFREGESKKISFLAFRYRRDVLNSALLVVVPKKIGSAPTRNRLKRLVREHWRRFFLSKEPSIECVVIFRSLPHSLSLYEVGYILDEFFKKNISQEATCASIQES